MDFASSKDILYLVLAFCALWFTVFVCWALWYVIRMFRDVSKIVREVQNTAAAVDRAVHAIREKVEASLGSFGVAAAGFKMLGSYLEKRKARAAGNMKTVAEKLKKKAAKVKKRLEEAMEEEEESEDLS